MCLAKSLNQNKLFKGLQVKQLQVKFILPTCKTKVGTGGKRRKTLRSPKSAAPSINNLKRIALSGISLDVNKKKKKKKTETHLQQKQHKYSITEMNVKKEAELHKHMP